MLLNIILNLLNVLFLAQVNGHRCALPRPLGRQFSREGRNILSRRNDHFSPVLHEPGGNHRAKAAAAAAKQAAAQAIAMAQNTNLAALQAEQAQANLEKYVYGVPVASVPPAVTPMPPAAVHPFPVRGSSAFSLLAATAFASALLPERAGSQPSDSEDEADVAAGARLSIAAQPKDLRAYARSPPEFRLRIRKRSCALHLSDVRNFI